MEEVYNVSKQLNNVNNQQFYNIKDSIFIAVWKNAYDSYKISRSLK